MTGKFFKFQAEVVSGHCPTCEQDTMLVGLTREIFRCMSCGADLEQHINGKIVYLPHVNKPEDMNIFVKEWSE